MIRKIILGLLGLLLIIQFIRPEKNESAGPQKNDIAGKYAVPDGVKASLEKACYDCHSNHTHYPWYADIQPVAWWLSGHVKDGKRHLNFSEFGAYTFKRQDHKLEEIIESQEDHWMPLESYTWLHKEARLSDEQRREIITWASEQRRKVMADSATVASGVNHQQPL